MPDERPPTPAHYHRGEANPRARLTEAKVRQIIGLLLEGQTQSAIAKQFGVGETTIGEIAKGESWKQVPRPANFANAIRHSRAKLTEAQVREIRRLLKTGHTQQVVALKFSTAQGTISAIARGQTWKHIPRD
jgi:transcriptional regulator